MLKKKKMTNLELDKKIPIINNLIKAYIEAVAQVYNKKGDIISVTFLDYMTYEIGDDYLYLGRYINDEEVVLSALFRNMITNIDYEQKKIDGKEVLVISILL